MVSERNEKRKLAIVAASSYSTEPMGALFEYARLTKQDFFGTDSSEIIQKLSDEFYSLIPKYRYPAADQSAENSLYIDPEPRRLFIDPETIPFYIDPEKIPIMVVWEAPSFLASLKGQINEDLYEPIFRYVKESENQKINLQLLTERLEKLESIINQAYAEYKKEYDRIEKRNAAVVIALGFSKGVPQKRIDKKRVYSDYVNIVRKEGKEPRDAVSQVGQIHKISTDGIIKVLHEYRKENIYDFYEKNHPSMLPKIKEQLKGFIPSRR
jgi:hypothetical protein